eukprot:jgi/Orpsp1_1/1175061/evm.model.c7180000052500.1
MNNYFILFTILLLNLFIKVYTENANFIVAISRKETDKPYDDEDPVIQKETALLVNDRMNEIFDIIEENQDTYKNNGVMDEKVEKELNSVPMRKRNGITRKYFFINDNDPKKSYKRSLDLLDLNNSTIEYIPIKSVLVSHICSILNYYAVNAYLSDETAKKVCSLDNVLYCEKSESFKLENDISNKSDNTTLTKRNNEENNENNSKYYNINAIKKETKWSDVSIQDYPYKDLNHLSILSQSPYIDINKTTDNNFYYPSSAGKGIDIYIIDEGANFNHEDYDTYEGTPDERTVICDAIINDDSVRYTNEDEKKYCFSSREYPNHGIMTSSMAGGKIFGVSKKANIHMISVESTEISALKGMNFVKDHATPGKTVISISLGGGREYKKCEDDKLKELIDKGFIVIVAAGNGSSNGCPSENNKLFINYGGYRRAISVGATNVILDGSGYYVRNKSNYGDCVDIHSPGEVFYPNVFTNTYLVGGGTSSATPIVAGVAASIMSENRDIVFNNELMRKTLIDMSIKNAIKGLQSSDTPNRFVNNGKRSIYSPDDTNIFCGSSLNISCSDGCCTKNGECIKIENDSLNECLIENGCQ